MIQESPVFSIVIPTYNRAHFIAKTLESVLRQSFTDFEVLVVDDGSKDNTEEVVKAFKDRRIHYFKKNNEERGAARNYGVAEARGEFINFFDSDDLMYPNHLAVAYKFINENDAVFFHLAYDHRREDNTTFDRVNQFDDSIAGKILFDNILSPNVVFLKKEIAIQFPFEENRVLASSEDWELWIRLISRFKMLYSNEVTCAVVHHDQRSLRTIRAEEIVARDLFLIENLRKDAVVMNKYKNLFGKFVAERYTFFMLSFVEQKMKREVLKWGVKA
ncbi:MAG TPA: glycosyltransferase family 2 protein, partial [Cyclobacteriaceae bacterium]|nr:glycosyltransferase family 2 protein [Cyclobacteriaceae bacterium]